MQDTKDPWAGVTLPGFGRTPDKEDEWAGVSLPGIAKGEDPKPKPDVEPGSIQGIDTASLLGDFSTKPQMAPSAMRGTSGINAQEFLGPGARAKEAGRSVVRGVGQGTLGTLQGMALGEVGIEDATRTFWKYVLLGATDASDVDAEGALKRTDTKDAGLREVFSQRESPALSRAEGFKNAEKLLPQRSEDPRLEGMLTQDFPEAMGNAMFYMASGLFTGGGGAAVGAVAALGGLADGYYDAQAHGADLETMWTSGLMNAGLQSSEAVSFGRFFGNLDKKTGGGLSKFLKGLLLDGTVEGGQEMFTQAGSNLVAANEFLGGGYAPDRKAFEGVAKGGVVGFMVGVLMSAGTQAAARASASQRAAKSAPDGTQAPGAPQDAQAPQNAAQEATAGVEATQGEPGADPAGTRAVGAVEEAAAKATAPDATVEADPLGIGTLGALAESGAEVSIVVPEGDLSAPAGTYPARVVDVRDGQALVEDPKTGERRLVPSEWVQEGTAPLSKGSEPQAPLSKGEGSEGLLKEGRVPSNPRVFLTRVEATHAIGLMDASQPVKPPTPVRLAVRGPDGTVYEGLPTERLHAQMVIRLGLPDYDAGWTALPADLPSGYGKTEATPAGQPAPAKEESLPSPEAKESEGAEPSVSEEPVPVSDEPGGLNAATPAQVAEDAGRTVSIKHRKMDELAAERGLDPIEHGKPSKKNQDLIDNAVRHLSEDPEAGRTLVNRLTETRDIVTDDEVGLLQVWLRTIVNLEEDAQRQLAQAEENGDTLLAEEVQARIDGMTADFDKARKVDSESGTEQGRAFQARQIELLRDMSLDAQKFRYREAKGEPLSKDEIAKHEEWAKKFEDLERRIDEIAREEAETEAKTASEDIGRVVKTRSTGFRARSAKRANNARERLRARALSGEGGFAAGAPLNPADLQDYAEIGADYLVQGVAEGSAWIASMTKEFGAKIKPHLDAIFKAAKALGPRDAREKVREAGTKGLTLNNVHALAETLLEEGLRGRETLIDAVHRELTDMGVEITRDDTMDMISKYGVWKELNQKEAKRLLREYVGEMQELAKIRDMGERGEAHKLTGQERQPPTDEKRRLTKIVNEMKKRLGLTRITPERQAATAIEAAKRRASLRISDLRRQVAARAKDIPNRTKGPTDPELDTMLAEIARLTEELDDLTTAQQPGHTDVMRSRAAVRALEKSLAAIGPPAPKKGRFVSPKEDALRAERDAYRERIRELRKAAHPGYRDHAVIQARITRRMNDIARLKDILARKDFGKKKPKRREVPETDRSLALLAEQEMVRNEVLKAEKDAAWAKKSRTEKVLRRTKSLVFDVSRNTTTAIDVSNPLRQSIALTLDLWRIPETIRGTKKMLASFRNEKVAQEIEAYIMNHPMRRLLEEKWGIQFKSINDDPSRGQEENIGSEMAEVIPGVRASNRAFTTYSNLRRLWAGIGWELAMPNATEVEMKVMGGFTNMLTGRADVKKGGRAYKSLEAAANLIWSPNLNVSRGQLLVGYPLWRGTARTRKLVAKQMARSLLGVVLLIGLWREIDDEVDVGLIPFSSDFGKIRIGNHRLDLLGGFSQQIVMFSRTFGGRYTTGGGKDIILRGEGAGGYRSPDVASVIGRFLRSKLAPAPGTILDIATGENMVGERRKVPNDAVEILRDLYAPLSLGDVYTALSELGLARGVIWSIMALGGGGIQSYESGGGSKGGKSIKERTDMMIGPPRGAR